jgi:hypothetical protein
VFFLYFKRELCFRNVIFGINRDSLMVLASHQFFSLLCLLIFIVIFITWNNSFKEAYGHGLSKDQSLPFEVSGKQIAVEGIMEPPFLNEDKKPTLTIRTFDEKTNETIKDLNYRIIAKFKNETILNQQFHSLDGYIKANLIPSNTSTVHELINVYKEQQQISKIDQIIVSSNEPITLKSKLLTDGGLYDISVFLEKSSNGLKFESDKKVDLFISIGKTVPFVIKNSTNNGSSITNVNNNYIGNLTLKVKTFYDDIVDFIYDQNTHAISFTMPFRWDMEYVNQIVNLHEEIVIPKSYIPLFTIPSFTGTLNDMEIPRNAILIDDYSDPNNRIVHIVIANFKLKEFTSNIIKEGGNPYAIFELVPIKK